VLTDPFFDEIKVENCTLSDGKSVDPKIFNISSDEIPDHNIRKRIIP